MSECTISHWRVKGAGGILLYGLALTGASVEVWNNLLNSPDPQSKVVAVLAVAALLLIPFGMASLEKGQAGRTVLSAALLLAFSITFWSGLKAYTNSQGQHILATSDTAKAKATAANNETSAREAMKTALAEAVAARKEAEAIRVDLDAGAKLAKAKANAVPVLEAYAQEQAILAVNGITCEMRPLNCPPLRTKTAVIRAEVDAATQAVATASANANIRAEALARAKEADAKAEAAKAWLQASQAKQDAVHTTETAGIHTMIAGHWHLDVIQVARFDGLGEALARLCFTLALSLCATPGVLLIGAAWQGWNAGRPIKSIPVHTGIMPVPIQDAAPGTLAVIDKTGLRPLVLQMLQEHGPAGSQKELARRIERHCRDIVERVAESTLSEVLIALENSKEIEREPAGPAKIVRLAGWKPRRKISV